MYTYKTSVISPYCDSTYYLSSEFCFNYVQEIAGRREMSVKTGIPHLLKENKSWVSISTHLEVLKRVYWMSDLTLETEGYDAIGVLTPRRVIAKDKKGDIVFKADAYFSVVSVEGGHHIIDPHSVTDRSPRDKNTGEPFAPRFKKFNMDEKVPFITIPHTVLRTDCDINGHMNNLRYTSWMIDALPNSIFEKGQDVQKMDVLFAHELHQGDKVNVKLHYDEKENLYYSSVGDAAFARIAVADIPKGKKLI